MKNLLLPILFVCIFTNTKAQQYHEFPKENARWVYHYYYNNDGIEERYDLYYIDGDTLINNNTYQIIKSKQWLWGPYPEIKDGSFNLFFREESKRIYFRYSSPYYDNEYLAYDFNLNVNDTFVNFHTSDSLVMIDEYEKYGRRAMYFKSLNFKYLGSEFYQEWIEGIGHTEGELFSGDYFSNLICFKTDECDTCSCYDDIITSNIPIQTSPSLNLYPNPATDYIRLELEDANNTIQILNTQGQGIYQVQTSDKTPTIPTQNFSSGIYFVIVINPNGNVSKGKFVKL